MSTTMTKITFAGLVAALLVHLEVLAFPVLLLFTVMVIDYATGLMAASHRGQEISSYKSIVGVAKKICLLLLVAVGMVLDLLVEYTREVFGFHFQWSFVLAAVIAVWLIANEIISILENMKDIGVHMPPWLLPFVKNIKSKAESISPTIKEEEKTHEPEFNTSDK